MTEIFPCFISYRHTGDKEAAKYVREFKRVLQKHLASIMAGTKVYLDEEYLTSGMINHELAAALCHSACYVIFYSRFHFDHDNPYCAREYRGMLSLEAQRRLQAPALQNDSLIFTVARRDFRLLPPELKNNRVCHDLTDVLNESDFRKRAIEKKLDTMAQDIADRYLELRRRQVFCDGCCNGFALPEVHTFQPWMDQVCLIPRQAMPGH